MWKADIQPSMFTMRLGLLEGSKKREGWPLLPSTILIWYLSSPVKWLLIRTPKSSLESRLRPTERNIWLGLRYSPCIELCSAPIAVSTSCLAEVSPVDGTIGSSMTLSSSCSPEVATGKGCEGGSDKTVGVALVSEDKGWVTMAFFTSRLTLETRISNWSGDNIGAVELAAC